MSAIEKPEERPSSKFRVVSMFSGCGGMDLGFQGGFDYLGEKFSELPFEIVWANDLNPYACKTYQENLGHDIRIGSVWDHFDTIPDSADLVIGGFPCQDISINGKRAGVAGQRSGLYRAMVDAIEKTQPKAFVAENVKGLLMKYNQDSLRQVISDFSDLGYKVTYHLYFAPDYGVPQRRERVLIVGTKSHDIEFTPPTPIRKRGTWLTSRDAIKDLESAEQNADWSHIWSLAQKSSDQGSRVLDPAKPAHTVRAECHGNNQFHYSAPRRISMREAARFQTFPDNFLFHARLRETERMIGNAVPPVLAWHVANQLAKTLMQIDDRESAGTVEQIAAE